MLINSNLAHRQSGDAYHMYLKHMLIVYALEDYINWNICYVTIIILNEHKKAW